MTAPQRIVTQVLGGTGSTPYPLGRHVEHHIASLAYAAPVLPRSAIRSVVWPIRIDILDQGSLGSCTGNAATYWVAADTSVREGRTQVDLPDASNVPVDEHLAVDRLYHLATGLDEFDGTWPPDDTGSSGIGVAKALRQLGLCSAYEHAFSVQAALSALQTGPILVGVPWYNSMFTTASDGRVPVYPSSGIAGGHEFCITTLDTDGNRVRFPNSWGRGWGIDGWGYVTIDDLRVLLNDSGDVTIPTPIPIEPTPTPKPSGCVPAALHAVFGRRYGRR